MDESVQYNRVGKDLIYRPPASEPIALPATVAYRFANDVFLLKSYLDKFNYPYKDEDLEDGPFGKFLRIKKGEK